MSNQEGYIPAATILLLRNEPAFEVLMVERHADIKFAGGALVFPGGKIDPGDHLEEWANYCDGLDDIPVEEQGPRIAAIREAFEEAGILLARNADGNIIEDDHVAALDKWRAKIEQDDSLFLELVKQEGLRLACDELRLFARWQPPAAATHRRYHTWFFAARTPATQKAREDGNEATEALWISPSAAIDARQTGERRMIFPTARNVELLALSETIEEAFNFAEQRSIVPIEPSIVEREDGAYVTIPDDLGYPVLEESLKTAFRS